MIIHAKQATVEFSNDGEMWEPLPAFDGFIERECKPIKVLYTEPAEPFTIEIEFKAPSRSKINRLYRTLRRLTGYGPAGKRGTSPRRAARRRHHRKLKRR